MSDTVSRKALLDWAIAEQATIHHELLSEDDDDDRSYLETRFRMYQKFRDKVESLPSTESEGEAALKYAEMRNEQFIREIGTLQSDKKRLLEAIKRIKYLHERSDDRCGNYISEILSCPSTSETAVQQARERIAAYITKCQYTYSVDEILDSYQNYYKQGYYVSHTTKDCIVNLIPEMEIVCAGIKDGREGTDG